MATSLTYASLLTDLAAYLERGTSVDPTVFAQLPRLINLAEQELSNKLKILGNKTIATTTLTAGVSLYTKPAGWRRTAYLNYGIAPALPLYERSYEYLQMYWPTYTQQAPPEFYAEYSQTQWLIVPTPDNTYPLETWYWKLLTLLDSGNQTNFWTDNCPQLLLYGALLQCTPFLKNDERIETWGGFYTDQLKTMGYQDESIRQDNSDKRQET